MVRQHVPMRLWDHGYKWVSEICSLTYTTVRNLNDIPLSQVTGETVDISEYLDFGFYDRVWYIDNAGTGPRKPARWLGVSHRVGNMMTYNVLIENGAILPRSSVQRVTNLELETDEYRKTFTEFDKALNARLKHDGEKQDMAHWVDVEND